MTEAFTIEQPAFDAVTGVATFRYTLGELSFSEILTFPSGSNASVAATPAFLKLLQLTAVVLGVSYFKLRAPYRIVVPFPLTVREHDFALDVYENGLGEFYARNNLKRFGEIEIDDPEDHGPAPAAPTLRDRALLPIGGGKDSLVSIEALRALGIEQTVTWIGGSQLIAACAARTELPTLNLGRALAPQLFELNRQGAYNGHIPVTVVNSAIMVLAALLHGVDQVVFSNERSASYGSLIEGTGEVNHQWSKGWACEQAFGDYVQRHVAADLHYYSLLRPLSELAVARQFARTDRYDAHFSSCNRNFHILGERPASRWCGVCPKCHFVFLALAPFMTKPRLVGIFGRNLLDDPGQTEGYDALLEYRNHKPFECVGEGRESRAAMAALSERPEWREDALVERFAREIRPQLGDDDLRIEPLLTLDDEQRLPPRLWERLRAYFAA